MTDTERGLTFEGESPTHPWTRVCEALNVGTRISGPQFFGFSDPLTQVAIMKMYDDREMEAANQVRKQ